MTRQDHRVIGWCANQATEPTTELTEPTETTGITTATEPTVATPDAPQTTEKTGGMPWWGIVFIALGAAGAGVGITLLFLKKWKGD